MINNKETFTIDQITWNDLDMTEIYNRMNISRSSVGAEVLKQTLQELVFDESILQKRHQKAVSLQENPSLTNKLNKIYTNLGKTKKVSFLDYIFKLNEIKPENNIKHVVLIVLLLVSIALIFVKPVIGIIALVVMIAVNIALYFRFKAPVEPYFNCIKYLASMVIAGDKAKDVLKGAEDVFTTDRKELERLVKVFAPIRRGSFLITNSVSGSLVDVIMDYIRMLFHVDLIKFHSMHKFCSQHAEDIHTLYDILGGIETCICIAHFRKEHPSYCLPLFHKDSSGFLTLKTENAYHPLVKNPVKNSITAERSILLTGSNASGKSTFLKMIAINQIFAQTIYTVLADSYETSFFRVFSSMALSDNILGAESYFVVEIKSMKRIFDALSDDNPVMIFVDEVLRGTNTQERIAASTQILRKLSTENALCFAATHDIELTHLLEDVMDNYHFSEQISDDSGSISFDYKLKKGRADSRNAILLLKAYGFPQEVVQKALSMSENSSEKF